MFGLGPTELVIIAVIVLLIFGAKRLPEIGKGIGGAIREFREVKKELSPGEEDSQKGRDEGTANKQTPSLESRAVDKVLESVPGVKKAKQIKDKAEKVKSLLS